MYLAYLEVFNSLEHPALSSQAGTTAKMILTTDIVGFLSSFYWYIIGALSIACASSYYRQYRRLSAFKGPWLAAWTDLVTVNVSIHPRDSSITISFVSKRGSLTRTTLTSISGSRRLLLVSDRHPTTF